MFKIKKKTIFYIGNIHNKYFKIESNRHGVKRKTQIHSLSYFPSSSLAVPPFQTPRHVLSFFSLASVLFTTCNEIKNYIPFPLLLPLSSLPSPLSFLSMTSPYT